MSSEKASSSVSTDEQQQIIVYNQSADRMINVQFPSLAGLDKADTLGFACSSDELAEKLKAALESTSFALVSTGSLSFSSLTYNEWEALRICQAKEASIDKLHNSGLPQAAQEKIQGFFESFTEGMQVKYLQGKRSWVELYEELLKDFSSLIKD